MILSSQRLPKILVFASIIAIFGLIEGAVWYKFSFPDHAVPGRHKITPNFAPENKLFGEFDGSARILIPVNSEDVDIRTLKGVQFKTGTYGQTITADSATIQTEDGQVICTSQHKFAILENQWTALFLRCKSPAQSVSKYLYLDVQLPSKEHWALYQVTNKLPAIQFWSDDPKIDPSFFDARNYGALWSLPVLVGFRFLCRVAIALGLTFMIFHRKERRTRRFLYCGLLIWCGLFWGQFFETVTYHNSDETIHVAGAVRSVTDENWPPASTKIRILGGKVQFRETFAKVSNPIIPGRIGVDWISDNDYFVNPESRSGTYSLVMRPITRAALILASRLDFICSDPVVYMRAFLSLAITVLVSIASWFYIKSGRSLSFLGLLVAMSIPAVLASLLTVWNYGLLTVLGTVFCTNLIFQTGSKSNFRFFIFSAILIPFLAELARSQILWLAIGPFIVSATWIFYATKNSNTSHSSIIRGLGWFALSSLLTYGLLILCYGDGFIPDRGAATAFLNAFSNHGLMSKFFVTEFPLLALGTLHLAAWAGSASFFLFLNGSLDYLSRFASPVRWLRPIWSVGIFTGILIVARKCSSIHDVSQLGSLASASPYPTFAAHFKEGYRALMSQTFSLQQDYFLIQTFFMAYGWLEITGSMAVYFVYRHLMELGLLAVLVASIKDMRTFLQLYVPSGIAFAIYFLSIWYGAWNGHFTIIGRLVFPASGLLLFPMLLASGQVSETYGRTIRMPATESLIEIVFFYLAINAMYGAFYLLPLRFVVGI